MLFCQNYSAEKRHAFPVNYGQATQLEYVIPGGNLSLDGVFLRELIETYPSTAELTKLQVPKTFNQTLCNYLSELQTKVTLTESNKDSFKDASLAVLTLLFLLKSKKVQSAAEVQ